MIRQTTFLIPPEIEAGLLSGDLTQYGGVVRNQLGQIVRHLKPVTLPQPDDNALARVAALVKSPRVLIATATATAATAAFVIAKRKRKIAAVPECIESYNVALGAYVEAVHEGRLTASIIDQLIVALDDVTEYADEDGDSIKFDFSTKQAKLLVRLVIGSTSQLAQDNDLDLAQTPAADDGSVMALRRHLRVQRQILAEAA